jgi:hypothetical protein
MLNGWYTWPVTLLTLYYPNCAINLSFRIFADDTKVFYSCTILFNLESQLNKRTIIVLPRNLHFLGQIDALDVVYV